VTDFRLVPLDGRDIANLRHWLDHASAPVGKTSLFKRLYDDFKARPVQLSDIEHLMTRRCRKGKHSWHIASVDMAGHQSNRTRVCDTCRERGFIVEQTEPRGYYGGPVKGESWGEITVRVFDRNVFLSDPAPATKEAKR
jgi:hypothetical protein